MFKGTNILAVLLTAIVLVALRFAWYDHFAGAVWAQLPLHVVKAVQTDPLITLMAFVDSLILAAGLVWLTGQTGERSPGGGLAAGLAVFIVFILTTLLQPYIYGGQLKTPVLPKALLIDGGYQLAALLLGGLIIGLLVRRRRSSSSAERAKLFQSGG